MRFTTPIIVFLLATVVALLPAATPATAATGLTQQRTLFKAVMCDARNGKLATDDPRVRALRDYPLYAYIEAARLRRAVDKDPGNALDKRVAAFIDAHPQLPPAQRLRAPWLKTLAQRERWQLLLNHSPADAGTTARCRAAHARIALNQQPKEAALTLWRVGRSQPQACDPVFAWLDQQGLLTADEIMRRARLALLAGQFGMVRYLSGKLPDRQAKETKQWLQVAQDASALRTATALPDDILAYAFKRYALRDWDAAAALFPQLIKRLQPGAQARYDMEHYIALLLAQDQQPEALLWFARLDKQRMDDHTRAWEVRAALWQRRWPLVIAAIQAMPAEQADTEQWQYWLGRALLATAQQQKAAAILDELATHRSYYGYLAADQVGQPYSFNEHPLPAHPQARARVLALPALARASELHQLGWDWQFRLEWNVVTADLDATGLREAARIAAQRGWHSRAIITLARSDYWDALDIRYPTPHLTSVKRAAQANGLDPAYVLAIMRTESLFQPSARSGAGAIGLMQLMPGTARLIAHRNKLPTPSASSLHQPAVNIRLGSRYLHRMKAKFGGNLALATAAYNAGPNAVKRWLPAADSVPAAIWIANIPYTETRKYVQSVMSHMTVFQQRLGEDIVVLARRADTVQPSTAYAGDD